MDSGHPAHCPVCGARLQPGAASCRECGRPLQVPAARRVTPAAPVGVPVGMQEAKKELGIAISVWLGLGAFVCLIAAVVLAVVVANTANRCLGVGECTTREVYQYLSLGIGLSLAAVAFAAVMGHALGWRWRGRL